MKKILSVLSLAILNFQLSIVPVFAQSIGVGKPNEAKIVDLGKLISTSISVVIILAGILVFVYLVWGGLEWLTSGGDKGKTESARNRITAALVGLAIIAAAWALTQVIATFFGVSAGLTGGATLPLPYP